VLVVRSGTGQVPDVKGRFVWLCSVRVMPKALHAAVDRGALDVIPTAEPKWEARLLARLEETLVEEPPLPAVKHFVAESAAAKAVLRKLFQAAQTSMQCCSPARRARAMNWPRVCASVVAAPCWHFRAHQLLRHSQ
jgi:hypothetical protein